MNRSKYFGKFKKNDLYGQWTVMGENLVIDEKSRTFVWCRCVCGIEKPVLCHSLLNKKTTRCNECNKKERKWTDNPNWKGSGIIPKTIISEAIRKYPQLTTDAISASYTNTCYVTNQPISLENNTATVMVGSSNTPRWVHNSVYSLFRSSADVDSISNFIGNASQTNSTPQRGITDETDKENKKGGRIRKSSTKRKK